MKQREGGDNAAVPKTHYTSQIRHWSPTHGKDAVIVWERVRPREKSLWYEEMLNKLVLFLLRKRGISRWLENDSKLPLRVKGADYGKIQKRGLCQGPAGHMCLTSSYLAWLAGHGL